MAFNLIHFHVFTIQHQISFQIIGLLKFSSRLEERHKGLIIHIQQSKHLYFIHALNQSILYNWILF